VPLFCDSANQKKDAGRFAKHPFGNASPENLISSNEIQFSGKGGL
jgi:hypothetical protein